MFGTKRGGVVLAKTGLVLSMLGSLLGCDNPLGRARLTPAELAQNQEKAVTLSVGMKDNDGDGVITSSDTTAGSSYAVLFTVIATNNSTADLRDGDPNGQSLVFSDAIGKYAVAGIGTAAGSVSPGGVLKWTIGYNLRSGFSSGGKAAFSCSFKYGFTSGDTSSVLTVNWQGAYPAR